MWSKCINERFNYIRSAISDLDLRSGSLWPGIEYYFQFSPCLTNGPPYRHNQMRATTKIHPNCIIIIALILSFSFDLIAAEYVALKHFSSCGDAFQAISAKWCKIAFFICTFEMIKLVHYVLDRCELAVISVYTCNVFVLVIWRGM